MIVLEEEYEHGCKVRYRSWDISSEVFFTLTSTVRRGSSQDRGSNDFSRTEFTPFDREKLWCIRKFLCTVHKHITTIGFTWEKAI